VHKPKKDVKQEAKMKAGGIDSARIESMLAQLKAARKTRVWRKKTQ